MATLEILSEPPNPTSLGRAVRRKHSAIASLEKKLEAFQKILDVQTRYRQLLGVKELDRPTYVLEGNYERFNKKYDLTIGRTS
ncbi:MAG: hypothetical protein ABSF09_12060 [Candidatus Bathyarchaeia archaeon]|jgi:hypothetical protein